MDYITLNNGVAMPQLGLGTFLIPDNELEKTICLAYELGYRKFDTAWRYYNEAGIAKALKKQGINRKDVFITTKINVDAFFRGGYKWGHKGLLNIWNLKTAQKVIQESFDNLNTDYIDLFLIHWPTPIPLVQIMYKKLTEFYKSGKIRAIGVCSSLPPHFDAFAEVSDVLPAVNQFEISPLNTQKELVKWCQDKGIVVEAMSTFSHYRSNEPRKEIIEHPQIIPVAEAHKKTVAQVILKWLLQQGIAVIPKTWDNIHLAENIDLFDFNLSADEMKTIDNLDQGKFLNYDPYKYMRPPLASMGRFPKRFRNWNGFKR